MLLPGAKLGSKKELLGHGNNVWDCHGEARRQGEAMASSSPMNCRGWTTPSFKSSGVKALTTGLPSKILLPLLQGPCGNQTGLEFSDPPGP